MTTPKSTVYASLIVVGIGFTNTLTSSVRSHALIVLQLGMLAVGLVFMRRALGGSYIPVGAAIIGTIVAIGAWWAS